MITRGERNNNPGNLDYIAPPRDFNGQVGLEVVPPGENYTPRFGAYDTALNGIRALAKQVLIDNQHHGKASIGDIIGSWAPSNENQTSIYAVNVAQDNGVGVNDPVDATAPALLFGITKAIIYQENGQVSYSDDLITAAVTAALGG